MRKIEPEPMAELNPRTASNEGIEEVDWITIETKRGRIEHRASLNDEIDKRVVSASYGWWFPEDGNWKKSNINILIDSSPPHDPAIGSLYLREIPCRVKRSG